MRNRRGGTGCGGRHLLPDSRLSTDGRVLLYFAGWKQHYSVYPASDAMIAAFPGELGRTGSARGRFASPLSVPVPVKLIERIARFRAE